MEGERSNGKRMECIGIGDETGGKERAVCCALGETGGSKQRKAYDGGIGGDRARKREREFVEGR